MTPSASGAATVASRHHRGPACPPEPAATALSPNAEQHSIEIGLSICVR